MCEINSGGVKTEWTRYGEDDAYQVGRRICIEYVYQRGKPSKVWKCLSGRMKVVLRVSIALRAEFDAITGGPRFVAAEARTKPGPPDAARTKPGPPAPRTLLEKKCAASLALTAAYATETEQFEYSVENGEARLTGLTDVGKAAVMLSIPAETAAGIPVTQIAGYALRDAKCYAPCCNARDYSHFLNSPCTNHSCIAQRNLRRGNQVREKVQTV